MPFPNIFNIFGGGEKSVLGLDISSSAVKVVQLRKRGGRAVLDTYGEIALGPYSSLEVGRATGLSTQKVSEALNDLLREAKTTTKKCGVAIPFGSSLMSLIEVPAISEKQLAEMIPIEARKYIPVPISEVTLDWWIIPDNDDEIPPDDSTPEIESKFQNKELTKKIKVLVVAIHNDTINKFREIVRMTGLDSSFFEIETFSTIRAVTDQTMNPVMILDMGAGSTKIYIVERGLIRNTHTINRGSQDITLAIASALGVTFEKAEIMKRDLMNGNLEDKSVSDVLLLVMDNVFSEANHVLLSYQKRYNRSISKVILSGGGVELGKMLDSARVNFQTEVEIANPFGKVEAPAYLEDVLKEAGPEFSVAVGVALRKLQEIS